MADDVSRIPQILIDNRDYDADGKNDQMTIRFEPEVTEGTVMGILDYVPTGHVASNFSMQYGENLFLINTGNDSVTWSLDSAAMDGAQSNITLSGHKPDGESVTHTFDVDQAIRSAEVLGAIVNKSPEDFSADTLGGFEIYEDCSSYERVFGATGAPLPSIGGE